MFFRRKESDVKIKDSLIINCKYKVIGSLAVETRSEMVPDPESATGQRQDITITGKLSCEEYFPIINTIESERYKVSDIFVNTEGFVSDSNIIEYIFSADNFLVKVGDPNK